MKRRIGPDRRTTGLIKMARHGAEARAARRDAWLATNAPSLNYILEASDDYNAQCFTWDYLKHDLDFDPRPDTTWRDYAAEAAKWTAIKVLGHLEFLALGGDAEAVEIFAERTIHMVRKLAELENAQPTAVKSFARRQRHWPVLKSFHKGFDVDHDEVLKSLAVGQDNPLNVYKGKWRADDGLGSLALEIWDHLETLRLRARAAGWEPPVRRAVEADRLARSLPAFGPTTWFKWFEVAKLYITETRQTPEAVTQLNKMVKAPTREIPSYKIKSRRTIISHFFTMLKEKFCSMAGANRD
jgi:hypothetical protein